MKTKSSFMEKFIDISSAILWEIVMIWCFVIVIFLSWLPMGDWIHKTFLLPNWALLIIGIAGIACLWHFNRDRYRHFRIESSTVLLFIVQFFVAVQIAFKPGWDAGNNLLTDAWTLANRLPLGNAITYYSQYNQNLLLLCIETAIMRVPVFLGVKSFEYAYIFVIAVQCLVSSVTGFLCYDVILTLSRNSMQSNASPAGKQLTGLQDLESDSGVTDAKKTAFFGWLLYILLVGTSPWAVVVYSDGMGLIFPIIIFWLWMRIDNLSGIKKYLMWAVLAAVAYAGYRIKATTIVAFIAVLMVTAWRFIANCIEKKKPDLLALILVPAIILGVFAGGKAGCQALYDSMGLEIDKEMTVTAYHYLMIGWNEEESGTFNGPDLQFTSFIPSYEDRKEANISESKRRIKSMLPFHIFVWQAKKTNENYHDGTFSWWVEGDFCVEPFDDKIPVLSAFLKDVFWLDGKYNKLFSTFEQTIWLLVLFLCLIPLRSGNKYRVSALRLCLIGTFFFVEIFEARSRYLYVFAPLFIAYAALGLETLFEVYMKKFRPKS